MKEDVIIVGGGMAGLSCAAFLHCAGINFRLLEATDRFGGRVGSDRVDGFLLDRGFQIYLDAYPTAAEILDINSLNLAPFQSGALLHIGRRFRTLADPFQHPQYAFCSIRSGLPFSDLLRMARLRFRLKSTPPGRALSEPDRDTLAFLREEGFSPVSITRFWKPFLGGIFLEENLSTSARMFAFVFSMFARGRATLPAGGMQAIPDQLAASLPVGSLQKKTRVMEIAARHVLLESGVRLEADHVVDARDPWTADSAAPPATGTRCFYFDAGPPPWRAPWLVLCPEAEHVQSLTFLNRVQPSYAPAGRHLLSVSTVRTDSDVSNIRADLAAMFGNKAKDWPLLASYYLPAALPFQGVGQLNPASRTGKNAQGIYCCGDHLETASIEGAVTSGKRAAEHILAVSRRY